MSANEVRDQSRATSLRKRQPDTPSSMSSQQDEDGIPPVSKKPRRATTKNLESELDGDSSPTPKPSAKAPRKSGGRKTAKSKKSSDAFGLPQLEDDEFDPDATVTNTSDNDLDADDTEDDAKRIEDHSGKTQEELAALVKTGGKESSEPKSNTDKTGSKGVSKPQPQLAASVIENENGGDGDKGSASGSVSMGEELGSGDGGAKENGGKEKENDPLRMPPRPWKEYELDPTDAWFDLERLGQKKPDNAWYNDFEIRNKTFDKTNMIVGFNITIREFYSADTFLKRRCIKFGVYRWQDISLKQHKRARHAIWAAFGKEFDWFRKGLWMSYGWWFEDAFSAWLRLCKDFLAKRKNEIENEEDWDPRSVKPTWPARPAKYPAPTKTSPLPLHFRYIDITLVVQGEDGELERHHACDRISLRTFMKKRSPGAADLDVKTANFEEFMEQLGGADVEGRVFVYQVIYGEGLVDKGSIENDKDLKSAIIRLSRDREPVMGMVLVDEDYAEAWLDDD